QTPLHRCILGCKATFVKLLLSRGADPRAVNGEGSGAAAGSSVVAATSVSFSVNFWQVVLPLPLLAGPCSTQLFQFLAG
ncbi:hypothetical protein PJN23_29180, partial [Mycobacterium kansasii]